MEKGFNFSRNGVKMQIPMVRNLPFVYQFSQVLELSTMMWMTKAGYHYSV